jgi:hypothetical protein
MMHPLAPAMMPATTSEARSITLRFQLPLYDRLRAAAEADRRSINSMAQLLLEEALLSRRA